MAGSRRGGQAKTNPTYKNWFKEWRGRKTSHHKGSRYKNKIAKPRGWFIKTALSNLGTHDIWGGDDPSGFDCSGFVIECLKAVGLLSEQEDYTADGLYRKLSELVAHPTGGSGVPHLSGGLQLSDDGADEGICRPRNPPIVAPASPPTPGTLLFQLDKNNHAYHVAICLDNHFQIGALGGGRTDTAPDRSWRDNAFVKIRPIGTVGKNRVLVDPFCLLD